MTHPAAGARAAGRRRCPRPRPGGSDRPCSSASWSRSAASEPGDHERFAHYVRKEKILESALSGDPVIALCGKVWVPSRDPNRFPVCPVCKEIYEGLRPAR